VEDGDTGSQGVGSGMIALDSETTGLDLRHGARPFFITICDHEDNQTYWEWDVDPVTRQPIISGGDIEEIGHQVWGLNHELVLHNSKFDVAALQTVMEPFDWPWDRTHDTLTAAHLLASGEPKNLTALGIRWLSEDISKYEERLKVACKQARAIAKRDYPSWRIARQGQPDMPSCRQESKEQAADGLPLSSPWANDMWLPRAICLAKDYEDSHPWWTVLRDYSNADSAITINLFKVMREEIRRLGLWEIYLSKLPTLRIAYMMETRGVTCYKPELDSLSNRYKEESDTSAKICINIAKSYGYELDLPKGGNNKSLTSFCFETLGLEKIRSKKAKTDNPSLNAAAVGHYLLTLDRRGKPYTFIKHLSGKRKRDTGRAYLAGYERYWLPIEGEGNEEYFVLHPFLNPTGTTTLRWSCKNPNSQNISKKGVYPGDPKSLRYVFGPAPGREWWSLDAQNIELRIPAYESGEQAFIDLFERPNEYPYFGSNHLLIAHILHPREFEACKDKQGRIDGRIFKDRYANDLYQATKNGNFAVQYGSVDRPDGMGTADRTYGIRGAQARIASKFTKQDALNQKWIRFAEKHGYIETMPDRTVNPLRGYPLQCPRTDYGKILPTVPLNYHVQGTAMQWTIKAMIRVQGKLDHWRSEDGFDGYIAIQCHDELVLDFPASIIPPREDKGSKRSNLWRIKIIKRLMAMGGEDIGIPTPVSVKWHAKSWGEGVSV
jgi:DNA polymerase I-like protein with 3'-5' exonuclease and polymerase domains